MSNRKMELYSRERIRYIPNPNNHRIWDLVNACYVTEKYLSDRTMEEDCRRLNDLHQNNWWKHGRPGLS